VPWTGQAPAIGHPGEDDMRCHVRLGTVLGLAAGLLLPPPAGAADGITRHLVTVKWLEQHLRDPNVLVLDASLAPAYAAQHIPGAVNVDAFVYGGKEMPLAQSERLYQSWGVSPDLTVILYDQGGSYMATRLFFSLYYHGFPAPNLAILDGGLAKWQEAGLPVTKEVPAPRLAGTFRIATPNEGVRARLPQVLAASGEPQKYALVEALGADWHFGEVLAFNRAGHIPNGILLPSADLYNPDKTFKSPEDLRRILKYLNIRPDQEVHTYCGGGVAASAPFFALKFLLDYPNVKLFTESELGWLSDERQLPYWTYDAPYLMREAAWLQWTSGQMLRTYLGAPVTIVDVRPADAYAQSHVPFSLHVPASVFRSHLQTPAALAQALGAAGVDPSLEAVVVSGGGVTPEAALAFLLLEELGQKKTSVLMDSMGRWTQQGFKLANTPTVVGPKKSPYDVAIEPKPYTSAAPKGAVISDAAHTSGVFPRVFVASGKSLPSQVPDGKVVHVPYADLLNADGTPRAAKDLWNILAKAGVPRYAELVCVADDPGEAAVNYFVLKLMGYPDVKVLAK
jgi:3-mercaptopyruvate sulfurtransferase SseA